MSLSALTIASSALIRPRRRCPSCRPAARRGKAEVAAHQKRTVGRIRQLDGDIADEEDAHRARSASLSMPDTRIHARQRIRASFAIIATFGSPLCPTDHSRERSRLIRIVAPQGSLDDIASVSDRVHETFAELDARCARVGQTAAHVGDRLQATDQVKSLAQEACSLILCALGAASGALASGFARTFASLRLPARWRTVGRAAAGGVRGLATTES